MFFYGTLCHRPLLETVLGPDSVSSIHDAVLCAHKVNWVENQPFPMISSSDLSSQVSGVLAEDLSDEDVARLNFYEGGFDYALKNVSVEVDEGRKPVDTQVYFPAPGLWKPGAVWSLSDWEMQFGEMTVEAAKEVMSYFGVVSPEVIAQRFPMIRTRASSRIRARNEPVPATLRADYGPNDIEVYDSRRPYAQYFTMEERELSFRKYSGDMSDVVDRAAFVGGDAVIVLPYDPVRDRVLVIEQFRMGPQIRGDVRPWLLEPIAGRIDGGETPEDSARREAMEEARLTLDRLIPLTAHYPSPGASTEYFYPFIALCDLPDDAGGIAGVENEAEDIRSHVISFEHLMTLVTSGEANCGPLILAAYWLAANRQDLRTHS
ncbi:NUDIX domain-containing protein [Aliiroseovarius sp. F20344]|uniref:NUDIX domain-containing protein n=1 Tax=Aliiroseovarius sp. F20344 TaxID=2926414 RepID=UPI001FF34E4A|nr:NUDIX domain-containing protein [Aliiroseovarius sp. F20344]MCK0142531.1 gamma-glutamylcyclotransferase [Aliiroseovarius sp. F20344]